MVYLGNGKARPVYCTTYMPRNKSNNILCIESHTKCVTTAAFVSIWLRNIYHLADLPGCLSIHVWYSSNGHLSSWNPLPR